MDGKNYVVSGVALKIVDGPVKCGGHEYAVPVSSVVQKASFMFHVSHI
jgi:hypothetical protein